MTKTKKKKRKTLRYIGFTLVTLMLIGLTCLGICGTAFAYYIRKYVSKDVDIDLDSFRLNFTSFIYYIDDNGSEVELEKLHGKEDRVWADLEEIPTMLQDAFVAVEDNTFWSHGGVNWKRTLGAALNYVVPFRSNFGGGSTITQQLIKNTTGDKDVAPVRKLREIFRALQLERDYTKDEILEAYLNIIFLGGRTYGIEAAAQTYFGCHASELTVPQATTIALMSCLVKNAVS